MKDKAYWLWYPGDFELYHALKQNLTARVERGMGWPAFWRSEGFRQRIVLWREYELDAPAEFTVHAHGTGFVRVDGEKHAFGEKIVCGPGRVSVVIHLGRIEALPCAFVEGGVIRSGPGWFAEDYAAPAAEAGFDVRYASPGQDPAVWEFDEKLIAPVRTEAVGGGFLYEWETELTAALRVSAPAERLAEMTVYCGESREEALAGRDCYSFFPPDLDGCCPCCALRFAYIPGAEVDVMAVYRYVNFPVRARFSCDDPLLERIWRVAEHTFRLCSGIFFLDGVKRDRWIWSGDAYQSLFISRYLLADPGVEQRTLTALRGNDPMTGHINTIVDYSLLWLLGVKVHYDSARDMAYLRRVYPKMRSLMDFCAGRRDAHGFLLGIDRDWVFVDWADIDKDGPCGAVQMLYYACFRAMADVAEALGDTDAAGAYRAGGAALLEQIRACFWSEADGAYIDSFRSGRRHISRQTNIFALRCGVADGAQTRAIVERVLRNDAVAAIRTPYFQFYALDALAALGDLDAVMAQLRAYWGGMLERGAVTFWEEFDPAVEGAAQYAMYGDPFGKSLCHAWAAAPVYLLARYFVGLELTDAGFVLAPRPEYFQRLDCTLPVGTAGGSVRVLRDGARLTVETSGAAGTLRLGQREYLLSDGAVLELELP